MMSTKTQPNNNIFFFHTKVGSSIFYNNLSFEEGKPTTIMAIKEKIEHRTKEITDQQNNIEEEMWNMSFDEAASREGARDSVWINPAKIRTKLFSYKITFDCTNNMAKYEALVLGLKTLKEFGSRRIVVHGDSKLVINQVKGIYQYKHPRLRAYRNLVLDLLEEFSENNLSVIPRGENQIVDALVFKILSFPNKKYEIEVKHRPEVPDNIKYWQVFEDDKQVESFLQMSDEFANVNIDDE
jgi:ribonuclease HI